MISKIQSVYLKGWAVLFMMFLHFGNKFVCLEYQYSWSGNDWEGAFQICVPIFLFLSGYGLTISAELKNERVLLIIEKQIKRALRLLRHYWFVTTPFILLALLMRKFTWSWESAILTITTLRCDWCPNAWFVWLYIELILLFPFFYSCLKRYRLVITVSSFIAIVVATKIVGKLEWVDDSSTILARQVKMLMNNIPIFIEGMLFAKYRLSEKIVSNLDNHVVIKCLIGGGVIALSIVCRAKIPLVSITELVHVPLCLLGLLMLLSQKNKLFSGICYIGKHSTTLWFIHGYICWTFLQSVIYSIRFWPLAFLLFVSISLIASVILDRIHEVVKNRIVDRYS